MLNVYILYGTTSTMEYSLDGGATWITCTTDTDLTGTDFSNVNGIEIRYKATGHTLPGAIFTITIRPLMAKLGPPQIIDVIRIYHPNVDYTMIAQLLSTAQVKFVRQTKLNYKSSIVSMSGQTVVGKTKASPLALTDTAAVYTWNFYKDGTVPSVTMDTNSNVIFFTGLTTVDSAGKAVESYSIAVEEDASITFYDPYGTPLTDFDKNVAYLYIEFIKMPANLTISQSSVSELQGEYQEALAHYVISELYPARMDMKIEERLMSAKHFRNMYDEEEKRAEWAHHMNFKHEMPTKLGQGEDFHLDSQL